MDRAQLVTRVRSLTRDFTGSLFREIDIFDFMNDAIDRMKQILPVLDLMTYLEADPDEPFALPSQYHGLIAVYASARCFGQDERHYQATTFMNEFEQKMEELKQKVENGEITITDDGGGIIPLPDNSFYVDDNYYIKRTGGNAFDYPEDEDLPDDTDDVDGGTF